MTMKVHLCCNIGAEAPAAGHECREALWSTGGACKTCQVKCYRQGFTKKQFREDNAKLCAKPKPPDAVRVKCHKCGKEKERTWESTKRHWPKCCGQQMSQVAFGVLKP